MKNNVKKELLKIANETEASNKGGIYSTNLYWSKKPYNIASEIIKRFTKPGEIVFDPFMGSGVTIIEAVKNNRLAIGVDINPISHQIVETIIGDSNFNETEFDIFISDIKALEKYYFFEYDNEKWIYTKVIYDKKPVFKINELHLRSLDGKDKLKLDSESNINNVLTSNYSIGEIKNFHLLENSRIAVKKGMTYFDLFTNRNLKVLEEIFVRINNISDYNLKRIMKYNLTSIIHMAKIQDVKMSSQWPLWIPNKNILDRNIIDIFIKKAKILNFELKKLDLKENLKKYPPILLDKPIQNISQVDIKKGSIDLVITDPPYFSQVPYSEYMQLYKPYIDKPLNFEDEIVISNSISRKKDEEDYFRLLEAAFTNTSSFMKQEGILLMYFHEIDLKNWKKIIGIFNSSGLSFQGIIHISRKTFTLKKILSPQSTLSGDAIWIFKKENRLIFESNLSLIEAENDVLTFTENLIKEKGNLTTTELYDFGVMEHIINNGLLEIISSNHHNLVSLFQKRLNWNKETLKWGF